MLLIGSAGAGKSTFVDYLQETALPGDVRSKTFWLRIDMNPAPISREEIYNWLRDQIVLECRRNQPNVDFDDLAIMRLVHAAQINSFRKGIGRLYEKDKAIYDAKLGDFLVQLVADKHQVAVNFARYATTQKGKLLIIVLDNCDKRLREEQLLMFEAAAWLQKEFRGLVILPLREETYDNHRNEPPLDTAIKDLVFRIEPPLFQRILVKRVELALRDIAGRHGQRLLKYDLPNGMQVEYPASEQAYFLTAILRSIFEHDRFIRRLIVGLSGRNMRRAFEIFLEFCTSGHIGTDEITKIRLAEGNYILPLSLVTNVLLRLSHRYYDSDEAYIKNLYSVNVADFRPHYFARLLILKILEEKYNAPGGEPLRGYMRVERVRAEIAAFGVEEPIFRRELEYLVKAFCIVTENFQLSNIADEDLVSIAPAGTVHLNLLSDPHYLAAVCEDTWFESESTAQRIANRISDQKVHYAESTVIENSEDVTEYLEEIRQRERHAYRSVYDDDSFDRFVDFSQARSKIARMERALAGETWSRANRRFVEGSVLDGIVRNVSAYGVFVELEPGLAGLVHASKLPNDFRVSPEFRQGAELKVIVNSVDRFNKKVDLRLS